MTGESQAEEEPQVKIVAKYEKAHLRSITGVWTFRMRNRIGMITVGHDCAKLWALMEGEEDAIRCNEQLVLESWRSAVQTADVAQDGTYCVIVGINSVVTEVTVENKVDTTRNDFGYLETVYATVAPDKSGYITAAYSGTLNKVGKHCATAERKEPYANVKSISCLKYSRDSKLVAVGHLEGAIDVLHTDSFKTFHKYEVHSMRIRKIEFLPGDEKFLSACDDRLIKLHSLKDFEGDSSRSTKAVRVYSAHNAPVTGLTIDEKSGGTRFASSSSSSQIFIWHIELTTPIISVQNDHTSTISALSFSPTGRHLISGGDDGLLHVFLVPGTGDSEDVEEEQKRAPVPIKAEPESQPEVTTTLSPVYQEAPQQDYQEYRPYAEPRTPPQEEEDIGDFVYGGESQESSIEQKFQPSGSSYQEYNPDMH